MFAPTFVAPSAVPSSSGSASGRSDRERRRRSPDRDKHSRRSRSRSRRSRSSSPPRRQNTSKVDRSRTRDRDRPSDRDKEYRNPRRGQDKDSFDRRRDSESKRASRRDRSRSRDRNSKRSASPNRRKRRASRDRSRDRDRRRSRSPSSASSSRSSSASGGSKHGDQEGMVTVYPNEYIGDKYKVLGLAGQGTFGTVLDVIDTDTKTRYAVKVVRSVKRYLEAADTEIDILERIKRADPTHISKCVRLHSNFTVRHHGKKHVCLLFEKLGRSLYEFIKRNHYRGFKMDAVRDFAEQLIQAVGFCHSIKLVHTDLKPENILLVRSDYRTTRLPDNLASTSSSSDKDRDYRVPESTEVRLIDFGGATFEGDHHASIINTRQYRSPEVLLGLGWSYPSDMWSIGCILAELATGELLFNTHDDLEHLALMEKILGEPLPEALTMSALRPYKSARADRDRERRAAGWPDPAPSLSDESHPSRSRSRDRSRSSASSSSARKRRGRSNSQPRADKLLHFRTGLLRWPEKADKESQKHVAKARRLEDIFPTQPLFVDLLRRLLQYEPQNRITAADALNHPFIRIGPNPPSASSSSSSTAESLDSTTALDSKASAPAKL